MVTKDSIRATLDNPIKLGVIDLEEATNRLNKFGHFIVISSIEKGVYFLSDSISTGVGIPEFKKYGFITVRTSLPISVNKSEKFPFGEINTIQEYLDFFRSNLRKIDTVDELLNELNNQFYIFKDKQNAN